MMHFKPNCENDDFNFTTGPPQVDSYQVSDEIVNAPLIKSALSRQLTADI